MKKNKNVKQDGKLTPNAVLNEVGGAVKKLCEHGYGDEGYCCCNCEHQLELFKHPMNRGEFDGRISESTNLHCCTVFSKMDKNSNTAIISDHKHGMCECHWLKGRKVKRKNNA